MAYVAQSIEGVNLGAIYDAIDIDATPEVPGWPHKIGTRVTATDDSQWIFADAGGTIAQYEVAMIDATFTALAIVGGASAAVPSKIIGFYQNATSITSGQAAWFMISGTPTIKVLGAAVKNVQLYTTGTSGALDDAVATGSQFPIRSVYITTTNPSATATELPAVAQYPTVGPIGTV